ncbi:putative beta-glucosidase [Helianthus anomalus]
MCTCSTEDACVRVVLFPHCNPHHRPNRHNGSPVIAHHRSAPNRRRLLNTTTPQAKRKKTEAARGTRLTPARILVTSLEVAPLDLQKLLNYMKEEYGNPPIYIHENDQVESRNGTMADTPRVEFLHA